MRQLIVAILLAVITGSGICFAQTSDQVSIEPPSAKVIAYYFHGSARCPTCRRMEQYSKEAVESNFKGALDSGKLEFRTVNIEERGNEHYIQDYQLYTKALVLSRTESGKEVQNKNLSRIWEYAGDRQKFLDYVTGEIRGYLEGHG